MLVTCLVASGCGYHTLGHSGALPPNIHTIAIPGFVSQSRTFRIEQQLTDAVVREFDTRTQFRIVHDAGQDADAVLKGTVLSASTTPLAYDSVTGRAASALVTISCRSRSPTGRARSFSKIRPTFFMISTKSRAT